jgi:hypothetical protein
MYITSGPYLKASAHHSSLITYHYTLNPTPYTQSWQYLAGLSRQYFIA